LPIKAARAAIFTSQSLKHSSAIRRACWRNKINLEIIGSRGRKVANPEQLLPKYDIVFAKARCALEALAIGNAVVLCDDAGLGVMVSAQNCAELRGMNFGIKALTGRIHPEEISAQLKLYDARDADAVCTWVRREADLEPAAYSWLSLYEDVVREFLTSGRDPDAELGAVAAHLAHKSYDRRVRWEAQQIRRLKAIPIIGESLSRLVERLVRRWAAETE
jgi:hypothetical protein